MNYLAHAYLSFSYPQLLVGNMISDFVKGRQKLEYSPGVQKGINLHRMIDSYTDFHEATKEAKAFLKPTAGLYAGAFIDVAYDHFLANDPQCFNGELSAFALGTYAVLQQYATILPERFKLILPYMIRDNWLYNYINLQGAEHSFNGLARRAAYLDTGMPTYRLFVQHYHQLQQCYQAFIPDVTAFVQAQLTALQPE